MLADTPPQGQRPAETDRSMAALERLITDGEDWLMTRILHYAKTQHYTPYTSTLKEAWRLSIAGLSASLLKALALPLSALELTPEADYGTDSVAAFGVIEARRHRERGVDLGMFLGLMKYYRQTYHDLVSESPLNTETRSTCHRVLTLFFDRVEIGFVTTWAAITDGTQLSALQDANRRMTNEKNKYLTVYESLPIAVILVGDDLSVENMNHAARHLVDRRLPAPSPYYRLEWKGAGDPGSHNRPFAALFPWLADAVTQFTRNNQPGMYFLTEMDSGNRRRHFHVRLSRMMDVSEKFRGTLVFLEDVSERVAVEQAIKEKEAFLGTILDAIQDGISVLNREFTIVQVNRAMEKWYPQESPLTGTPCYRAYHGRQTRCDICPAHRAMQTGEPQVDEIPLTVGGTRQGWIELYAYPLKDPHGTVTGVVEYVRDITERKNGEAALRESDRLKGVLETAGAVGHELNQPLQSVLGQCELLFMDLDASSPVAPRMSTIRDQVYKMGDITRKLMGITRYRTKRYGKSHILDLDEASNERPAGTDR